MAWTGFLSSRKTNSVFGTIAVECVLFLVGAVMNWSFLALAYLPFVLVLVILFWLMSNISIVIRINDRLSRINSCVLKVGAFVIAIASLTCVGLLLIPLMERRVWETLRPDQEMNLVGTNIHLLISFGIALCFVLLYRFSLYLFINRPSQKRGRKVLSWVIRYLQNETEFGRGKNPEYLIEVLATEVKRGTLHLWARQQSRDVFVRPKDFKRKHCVFELLRDQYRIHALVDESILWGPKFIEDEIIERWPPVTSAD